LWEWKTGIYCKCKQKHVSESDRELEIDSLLFNVSLFLLERHWRLTAFYVAIALLLTTGLKLDSFLQYLCRFSVLTRGWCLTLD
jgi:UDP-N-acetylmuramyl pentapeptide synthase